MPEPTAVKIYPPGSFPITVQVVVSPSGFFVAPIGTTPKDTDAYRRFESLEELADMVGVSAR